MTGPRFESREFDVSQPGGWRLESADGRRIIAALAFCEGVSTPDLERLTPKDVPSYIAHIEKLTGEKVSA